MSWMLRELEFNLWISFPMLLMSLLANTLMKISETIMNIREIEAPIKLVFYIAYAVAFTVFLIITLRKAEQSLKNILRYIHK